MLRSWQSTEKRHMSDEAEILHEILRGATYCMMAAGAAHWELFTQHLLITWENTVLGSEGISLGIILSILHSWINISTLQASNNLDFHDFRD